MGRGALVVQADGARRYQYNPRFQDVMNSIPMGSIYDRNGLPLATGDWAELEKHRAEYQQLGVDIDRACSRSEIRHYPFGGLTFDLLGDLRTRERWGAGNTSFVERDFARRLRGYDDRPTLVEVKNPKTKAVERVLRYDYRELVPLLRHRYDPGSPEVRRVLDRPRDVHMSVDARLQVCVAEILAKQLKQANVDKGAAVVLDPATGDLLASVSLPQPDLTRALGPSGTLDPSRAQGAPSEGADPPESSPNPYLDRARYGLYPPGSTFKVVTAMAALRKDPALTHKTYQCIRLPDGRVGNYMNGSKRPIRDDIEDKNPHGTVDMERGIVVSCNAYFAQLGTYDVGAEALLGAANLLGIAVASPGTAAQLRRSLPQSSYGQGQVVASPFQLARVAATVANGGAMPQGRWITDENNVRTAEPQPVLDASAALTLAKFMREVVTSGTGRRAAAASVPIAGKTGTAELADAPSHAWFIGYAPYGPGARKIAFSVLVENGVYGGTAAAPAGAEIVDAAAKLGLIEP
jgi:cell division protein FtsI/penicillin-binding protein 2